MYHVKLAIVNVCEFVVSTAVLQTAVDRDLNQKQSPTWDSWP